MHAASISHEPRDRIVDDYTTISSIKTRGLGGAKSAALVRGNAMPPSSAAGKLSSSNRSELDSLLSLALSLSSAAPSARSSSSTLRSASAADSRGATATSVPLPLTSRSPIAVLAPRPSSSSPTISTAGENLTARLPGVRNPAPGKLAADSRREAREDRIDRADAGSALTAGRGARAAVASASAGDELTGGFLLQSRAFRRHAKGADLALLFLLLLFFLFSSLPSPGGTGVGVGGGRRSDGACG